MAIVMAMGIPSSTMNPVAAPATVDTDDWSHPHVACELTAMTWRSTPATAADATHLICWRSSDPPVRYRCTRATKAAPIDTSTSTDKLVFEGTEAAHLPRRARTPEGLGWSRETR